jgi:ornithine carbamoyltransferase
MKLTKAGKGPLYALPPRRHHRRLLRGRRSRGEVFDRYRDDTYREASYKPYIIAAMILLGKAKDPAATLAGLLKRGSPRSAMRE